MKRMDLTSPEGAKVTLQKVLSEGECEFWDVLCPGFAPNPFCFSFWFWGFSLVFFGLVGRCPLRRRCSLGFALVAACVMHA